MPPGLLESADTQPGPAASGPHCQREPRKVLRRTRQLKAAPCHGTVLTTLTQRPAPVPGKPTRAGQGWELLAPGRDEASGPAALSALWLCLSTNESTKQQGHGEWGGRWGAVPRGSPQLTSLTFSGRPLRLCLFRTSAAFFILSSSLNSTTLRRVKGGQG